jgi:predicted CopG family antitoxin
MISIPITDEAYEALKARNPGIEQDLTSRGRNGQLRIWVVRTFLDQLLEVRRPSESYSDVIMRLATAG